MANMHDIYMQEAIKLAKKGSGKTFPNPIVGAVIVKNNRIIGKGYHKKAGSAHAEIEAINSAKESVNGATLYVTLEPCSHTGRTPPCVNTIISAGIQKVVYSLTDPNPRVKGHGIAKLLQANIETIAGSEASKARNLNEQYFIFHEKKRPYISIKYAASLDGKLATSTRDSKWITNNSARSYSRKLRTAHQAILVGIGTVLADDPSLGGPISAKQEPLRIILDSKLRIPLKAQVLRNNNVLIATTASARAAKKSHLLELGFKVISFNDTKIPIGLLLDKLREMEVISILVEGGGEVIGDFIDHKLVDYSYGFYAPIFLGGHRARSIEGNGVNKISDALNIKKPRLRWFGDNFLIEGQTL